jgi:glycerol uptake facilitator-like aquaporin
MLVGEFLGTAVLASAVLAEANSGVLVNRNWFVAATAGVTLAMLWLAIGKLSGAHVNPAVTIGLWTLRKIQTTTAVVFIAAQILGGAVALRLFQYFQNDVLQSGAGRFDWRVFVAEMIGTFVFTFGLAAVVTQRLEGYRAAFTIGASFMLGAVIASTASNGFLNPAVALGNNSWSWVYATAPIAGAVVGMNVYDLFLAPESSFKAAVVSSPARSTSSSSKSSKKSAKRKR